MVGRGEKAVVSSFGPASIIDRTAFLLKFFLMSTTVVSTRLKGSGKKKVEQS